MSEVADRADSNAAERGNEDFGWVLGVLLRTYRDQITEAIGDFPLGARGYQTLREVAREQQPSQLALASHLGIDRTVMTYVIDELEEAGLVERRPNPDDRRQRRIVATRPGCEAVGSKAPGSFASGACARRQTAPMAAIAIMRAFIGMIILQRR